LFIGWDWATETHDVTVMDNSVARVARWEFTHIEDDIARTLAKLAEFGEPGDLPVAIDTTRGLVVDRLVAAGHPVVPVHPNAFHAMRPRWGARWGASKAKTDAGDGLKLADYQGVGEAGCERGQDRDAFVDVAPSGVGAHAEVGSALGECVAVGQPGLVVGGQLPPGATRLMPSGTDQVLHPRNEGIRQVGSAR
jgi:transposase